MRKKCIFLFFRNLETLKIGRRSVVRLNGSPVDISAKDYGFVICDVDLICSGDLLRLMFPYLLCWDAICTADSPVKITAYTIVSGGVMSISK